MKATCSITVTAGEDSKYHIHLSGGAVVGTTHEQPVSAPHDRRPVLWEGIPDEVKTKARAQVGYKRFSLAEEYEQRQRELRDRRTPDLPACSACGSHVPESELTADE